MASGVYTIAVVDDDARTCEVLKQMIKASSREYRVICAYDGKKGLSMITRQKPDMVILDIDMPKMNGLELLEELKKGFQTLHVPIIMLTGSDSEENATASLYWYAEAYLTKPCTREKLMSTIRRSQSCRTGVKPGGIDR